MAIKLNFNEIAVECCFNNTLIVHSASPNKNNDYFQKNLLSNPNTFCDKSIHTNSKEHTNQQQEQINSCARLIECFVYKKA